MHIFLKHPSSTFFPITAHIRWLAAQWQSARTSLYTCTSRTLYLVRKYFCFLGMMCLFALFQTQYHLLKP